MSSTVEQIKARLSILDVVQSYIKLQKAGANFKANCPFHQEKTPSFFVSPGRESYHCFGCGRGGDIFSFVEEIEGLEFYDTLKLLADKAGIEIERASRGERSERGTLINLLEDATRYYESNLLKRGDVGEYLKERGMEGVTAKKFRIGYATASWDAVLNHLKGKNYTEEQIEKAGMSINGHDRFRARIMFPLSDSSGRIVGFSGRVFEQDSGDNPGGKYINTPETALYNKSKVLYGFNVSKDEIRKADACVLVEGQMDVVMSHQAGIKNTVAVSGTAFTDGHAALIERFTRNLIIAFDMDDAGFSALDRAVPIALRRGFTVTAVPMDDGKDPADIARDNPQEFKKAVAGSVDIIDFYLSYLAKKYESDKQALVRAVTNMVLPYIAMVPNAITMSHYVQKVDGILHAGEESILAEVRKAGSKRTAESRGDMGNGLQPEAMANRLALLERRLIGLIVWKGRELSSAEHELIGDKLDGLDDKEQNALAMEAEFVYTGIDSLDSEVEHLTHEIIKERLKMALHDKERAIKAAEAEGDESTASAYLVECNDIVKQLTSL